MFGDPARMFPRAPLWLSTGLLPRLRFFQRRNASPLIVLYFAIKSHVAYKHTVVNIMAGQPGSAFTVAHRPTKTNKKHWN